MLNLTLDYQDIGGGCNSYIPEFHNGVIVLKYNFKWVILDTLGRQIAVLPYDYVNSFSDSVAIVFSNEKRGYIDLKGNAITPIKYYHVADSFSEGLAAVSIDSLYGYIDKRSNLIIPYKYEEAGPFSQGLASVSLNSKYGLINKKDEIILPFIYNEQIRFMKNLAVLSINGKKGVINRNLKPIVAINYEDIELIPFLRSNININIKKNKKWGCIDKNGSIFIPLIYEELGHTGFQNGLLAAKLNDKWGYIDVNNKIILPFIYEYAEDFIKDLGYVILKGQPLYIDKKGGTHDLPYRH